MCPRAECGGRGPPRPVDPSCLLLYVGGPCAVGAGQRTRGARLGGRGWVGGRPRGLTLAPLCGSPRSGARGLLLLAHDGGSGGERWAAWRAERNTRHAGTWRQGSGSGVSLLFWLLCRSSQTIALSTPLPRGTVPGCAHSAAHRAHSPPHLTRSNSPVGRRAMHTQLCLAFYDTVQSTCLG